MNTVVLTKTCPLCGCEHNMSFDKEALEAGMTAWKNGALIQNAFPSFTPSQREFLLTGICDCCWDRM